MTQVLLHSFIHPQNFTYSLTHLISHTSDRTLTKSPTHPFTKTFACLLNYSHLRSIYTFYPFIDTFIPSLISKEIAHDDSLTHWIIHTLNQPSIRHDEGFLLSKWLFFIFLNFSDKELYSQWSLNHDNLTLVSDYSLRKCESSRYILTQWSYCSRGLTN